MENRINRFLDDGIALPDADAARVLVGVQALGVRDAAWAIMTQDDHHAHRALWTDLTRRAPDEVRAPAATMLAFSAWLGGDGAGAWTALDQIPADQADYRLAALMSSVLENAVPPSRWADTIRPALLGHDAERPATARDVDHRWTAVWTAAWTTIALLAQNQTQNHTWSQDRRPRLPASARDANRHQHHRR